MRLYFNQALKVQLATNALIRLAASMLGPIYAIFVEEIGGDLMDAGLTSGVFALVAGVTVLVSGKYSDRIKENELIMALGYAVVGVGFLLYTAVDSIWSLFAVQVFTGLGEAVYAPAFDSIYSKHLDGHKSGWQWSIWEAMFYVTAAVGAVVGSFIVVRFGFDSLFVMMSSLCFVSAIYIYFLPRRVL